MRSSIRESNIALIDICMRPNSSFFDISDRQIFWLHWNFKYRQLRMLFTEYVYLYFFPSILLVKKTSPQSIHLFYLSFFVLHYILVKLSTVFVSSNHFRYLHTSMTFYVLRSRFSRFFGYILAYILEAKLHVKLHAALIAKLFSHKAETITEIYNAS